MGFRDAVAAARIDTAAEARMKAGRPVFAYRLQVPQGPMDDMAVVADAIEAVEARGWQLDRMEPDSYVGKGGVYPNVAWMLVFRVRR